MSGHSKWATIKRKKSLLDVKKGKIFSKLAREITVAAKAGGGILENNPRLKLAVLRSRQCEMPSKNIEAAIKRGEKSEEKQDYVKIQYEGYGSHGVAIIIDCLTDNKNRTVAEVRRILNRNGGRLGETGCVGWKFEEKGCIVVQGDVLMESEAMWQFAIEVGAQDVGREEEGIYFTTDPVDFVKVLEEIRGRRLDIAQAELMMVPQSYTDITAEQSVNIEGLLEDLEDLEDVQSVYANYRVME